MKSSPSISNTYSGRNLHGQVVHELGKRIVGGTCAPGDTLPNEEELCRELGVSRTALRESVKVLAAKGLVESRPRIGTRVRASEGWNMLDPDVLAWRCATAPDAQFILQLSEMREIIEPASAGLAARNRSRAQLKQIEDACEAMSAAKTIDEWVGADLKFHTSLLIATNNPLLRPLAAMIGSALESLLGVSARKAGDFKVALPEHRRVLDAIRDQDSALATEHMARLLADTRGRLVKPAPRKAAPRKAASSKVAPRKAASPKRRAA